MNDKDPPPFGYTFSEFLSDGAPSTYEGHGHGQSLLNDLESQHLTDFFSTTDPFDLPDSQAFPSAMDAKASAHDYNNWADFIAPATVHRVTTTIPDQAHLQHGFHHEQHYAPSLHTDYMGNTQDDLQAASTLFNNSQPSYSNSRSHNFHDPLTSSRNASATGASESSLNALPMVVTPHGPIHEQLAALIPNHHEQGTLDAQLAAQWAATSGGQQPFGPPLPNPDPVLKRSYSFGTDYSFSNPSGYIVPNGQDNEMHAVHSSIHHLQRSQHIPRTLVDIDGLGAGHSGSPIEHGRNLPVCVSDPDDDELLDEAPSSEDEEEEGSRPPKKRKKSTSRVSKDTPKKGARNAKNRKPSLMAESSKKKRTSAAAQRQQRENLTEEQKRNNHIHSEQKRRDLIKQGYEDLHELVPAVRGGGLSKSQVLMEAVNFLEKLIQDNDAYRQAVG
ncbi:hypothetical protein EJ02DRAFT_376692 [Clathrospora elynae]|uniref:BHLH domain-containing protein n=1 Tax=Clathrospora elynae TaxID=706981 RepID=A0A6A5SN15_9PLEO|nr:hypothetical protein EJ02DRAFT_376692 [Clathrospora elynae]